MNTHIEPIAFNLNINMKIEDKINLYQERANSLRSELINSIVTILKDNDLTEIKLSKQPDVQPWVVWFDRNNYGYDSRVVNVSLQDKGFAITVYDEDCCCSATQSSIDGDLACTNIDWLCSIFNSIIYTLSLPKSVGIKAISEYIIEWSYEEPGLSEMPENELEQIQVDLANGLQEGKLCYYDEYDVEYNGTWKIKK